MFACLHTPHASEVIIDILLHLASNFSPSVEASDQATVVFSIAGLGKLIGSPHQIASEIARQGADLGIHLHLAIAATPDAALHAARRFPGVTLISKGEEGALLGEIDLNQLPMPADMLDTLARLGIHTFAEFIALPPLAVVERFGMEGLNLQDVARGCRERPLLLERETPRFEQTMELEDPLENLEPLLFVFNRMLTELCSQLKQHGVSAGEMRLLLHLGDRESEERTFAFPVPICEPHTILKLLQLNLEAHPPCAAVAAVSLRLLPVKGRLSQNSLFSPAAPEPAGLQITLARIASLVGESNAGSPELLNTHRPDAFLMRPFSVQAAMRAPQAREASCTRLALRQFRPPLSARVIVEKGYPRRLAASGVSGNVLTCSGPWRGSGGWWSREPWARDEWDISLSDGGLYKIYRQHPKPDNWFIAGVYD